MNKKNMIIAAETVPIISAILSLIFLLLPNGSNLISRIMPAVTLVAFLGFIFFFVGRKFCKKNKIVKILGILDILSTVYVIVLYIMAVFSFGL